MPRYIIKPGYVGIVYSLNSGVEYTVLSQGYKLKAWAGEVSGTFDIYGSKRSELNAQVLKHVRENFGI